MGQAVRLCGEPGFWSGVRLAEIVTGRWLFGKKNL